MPAAQRPDPTAADVRGDIARLIGAAAGADARFGVALSGGADSSALLVLAAAAFPGRVAAATVDHGLRTGSDDEARRAAAIAAQLAVPHHILRPAAPIAGSLQAAARAARYALLDRWRSDQGIDWLLTAHHADDQRETLLMRAGRGSGITGLAGIRACNGHVLRPLLAVRHGALERVCTAAGVVWIEDPSNRDPRFDRVRLRSALTAADQAGTAIVDAAGAAMSARRLATADAALAWSAASLFDARCRQADGGWHIDASGLPAEYAARLLLMVLQRLDPDAPAPRGANIDAALDLLDGGGAVSVGAALIRTASSRPGHWVISPAPPRRIVNAVERVDR